MRVALRNVFCKSVACTTRRYVISVDVSALWSRTGGSGRNTYAACVSIRVCGWQVRTAGLGHLTLIRGTSISFYLALTSGKFPTNRIRRPTHLSAELLSTRVSFLVTNTDNNEYRFCWSLHIQLLDVQLHHTADNVYNSTRANCRVLKTMTHLIMSSSVPGC